MRTFNFSSDQLLRNGCLFFICSRSDNWWSSLEDWHVSDEENRQSPFLRATIITTMEIPMMQSPPSITRPSRRQLLAAGGTAVLTTVAGCSRLANFIADQVLEDVNVFNETAQRQSGTIQVTGPAGESVLDDSFDLSPSESEDDDNDSTAVFADVWTETGSYTASLTLDGDVDGQSEATETVTIRDPDDEMLAVVLGEESIDEPIGFRVAEDLTGFQND